MKIGIYDIINFFYLIIFVLLRMIIYIFWEVTQGRKELIVLLRKQIVNVSVFEFILHTLCVYF